MRTARHQAPRPRTGAGEAAGEQKEPGLIPRDALTLPAAITSLPPRTWTCRLLWGTLIACCPVIGGMQGLGWLPAGWRSVTIADAAVVAACAIGLMRLRTSRQRQWVLSHGRAGNPREPGKAQAAISGDRITSCELEVASQRQEIAELRDIVASAYRAAGIQPLEPRYLKIVSSNPDWERREA